MYKGIKCMCNKLLYLNFILYDVTLVADLSRKIKIFYYIMLYKKILMRTPNSLYSYNMTKKEIILIGSEKIGSCISIG